MKIFIYGVPGVGKTYFSHKLGQKFGIKVVEADGLRLLAQQKRIKEDYPFLYTSTCWAFQLFGDLTKENVIKGLLAVRKSMKGVILEAIGGKENFVLEGAFLDPHVLRSIGRVILLTCVDEDRHYKQFLTHREKILDRERKEFRAARIIQHYLLQEAEQLGVEIVACDTIASTDT